MSVLLPSNDSKGLSSIEKTPPAERAASGSPGRIRETLTLRRIRRFPNLQSVESCVALKTDGPAAGPVGNVVGDRASVIDVFNERVA